MFFSMCCQWDFVCVHINLQCFTLLGLYLLNHRHPPVGCEQALLARRRSTGTMTMRCHPHYLQSLSSSTCPSCTGACRSRTCRHGRTLRPTTQCQSGTSGSPPDSAPKQRFLIKEEKGPNPELPEFPSLTFITKGPPLSPSQESPRWFSSGRYPATCPRTLLWLPKAENSLLLT